MHWKTNQAITPLYTRNPEGHGAWGPDFTVAGSYWTHSPKNSAVKENDGVSSFARAEQIENFTKFKMFFSELFRI